MATSRVRSACDATSRTAVMWDVDHTLIDTGGLGRELYKQAFETATKRPFRHAAKISGSTELRILVGTLALHGITPTHELRDAYAGALAAGYRARAGELGRRGRALAGAVDALNLFAELGWVQTVVTGNLREVCWTKLDVFGLAERLDLAVGGYAEDSPDRAQLVAVSMDRAQQAYRDDFRGRTIMIGDTPADVGAGLHCGVPVVAVATGRSTEKELSMAGAAATLPDLADVDRVRAAITGLL